MNRASMIANLPAILKHVKKDHLAEAGGQAGLFGDAVTEDLNLIELPEWDEDTKLYNERKALGCFLTGHPILKARAKYERSITHTCRERDDMLRSDSRSRIVVAGMIVRYEIAGRIAFLEVQDQTGTLDTILFSEEQQRFAHCLMVNSLVALKLKPRHSETRSSLQLIEAHRLGHWRPKLPTKTVRGRQVPDG